MSESEIDLRLAVREVLEHALQGHEDMDYDTSVVCDEITCFVFRDDVKSNWCNRYERLYELQDSALMIARGWMLNCAADIHHYRETPMSIIHYIESTYGVHHDVYAA